MAEAASYSPDGARLAYVPLPPAFDRLEALPRRPDHADLDRPPRRLRRRAEIPRENSNDFNPMWVGDKVYFLSDRDGPVTLFAYDPKTQQGGAGPCRTTGLDIKSASAGPAPSSTSSSAKSASTTSSAAKPRQVNIRVAGDLPGGAPAFRESRRAQSRSVDLSPTGARAVFEARGEILTVPAEKGDIRNLTNTTGRGRARPGLVAGRQVHRLLLRRIRRVRAAHPRRRTAWAR